MKMQRFFLFKPNRARSLGFTLVELMVVVALVAVVSAIAIPNFQDLIARNNIASQMNEFIATLHLAKNTAIQRGKYVTICRTTDDTLATPVCNGANATSVGGVIKYREDWSTGWMIFVEDDPAGSLFILDPADVLIKRFPARTDNYYIRNAIPSSAQHLTFNPLGQFAGAGSAGYRFGFGSSSASNWMQRSICITSAGSIRTVNAYGSNACDF